MIPAMNSLIWTQELSTPAILRALVHLTVAFRAHMASNQALVHVSADGDIKVLSRMPLGGAAHCWVVIQRILLSPGEQDACSLQ